MVKLKYLPKGHTGLRWRNKVQNFLVVCKSGCSDQSLSVSDPTHWRTALTMGTASPEPEGSCHCRSGYWIGTLSHHAETAASWGLSPAAERCRCSSGLWRRALWKPSSRCRGRRIHSLPGSNSDHWNMKLARNICSGWWCMLSCSPAACCRRIFWGNLGRSTPGSQIDCMKVWKQEMRCFWIGWIERKKKALVVALRLSVQVLTPESCCSLW